MNSLNTRELENLKMNIQITKSIINNTEINSVNARELYNNLGLAKGQYSRWIQNNLIDQFLYNDDYIGVRQVVEGNEVVSHIVTLDTAKHLCMMAKTQNAMKFRKFFIDFEKEFNKPMTIEQLLQENIKVIGQLQTKVITLQNKVVEDKPKVEFFEAVTNSKSAIDMGQVAKVLDKDIGRNKLFEILRNKKILQKDNIPFQTYIDRGYFRVIEVKYTKPDGSTNISLKTLVYQKGVSFINKVLES